MWCLSRQKSGVRSAAYVGSSYPCPLCSWNAREETPHALSLFHMGPSVSGITRERWRRMMLTVPVYPDSPSVLPNVTHGGYCSIPMSLHMNSKNCAVSILNFCFFYVVFNSEGSWHRVQGSVHTGVFSDTVLQTNVHSELCAEEWPPRSTPTTELISAVVCDTFHAFWITAKPVKSGVWNLLTSGPEADSHRISPDGDMVVNNLSCRS